MSLHNFNSANRSWQIYTNTLSSINGDNLIMTPYDGQNLALEVSGNNNIIIKKGIVSYNLSNLITLRTIFIASIFDASFTNINITRNLNPLNVLSNINNVANYGTSTLVDNPIYNIHRYNSSSTFTPAYNITVEVLIVGGGGGGGASLGGGGGGGGVVYLPAVRVTAGTNYSIVVGNSVPSGTKGQDSTAFTAIAAGGGTSGSYPSGNGTAGGNGGGAAANDTNNIPLNKGGTSTGNSLGPNSGFIYGNRGGNMTVSRYGNPTRAAGGGGAGDQSIDTCSNIINTSQIGAGSGGVGIKSDILGTMYYWGGGGGGAAWDNQVGGWGGLGGGGGGAGNAGGGTGGGSAVTSGSNGSLGSNSVGGAGGANTGGGGGGGNYSSGLGGAGGSGIVVIRYPKNINPSLGSANKRWGNAYIQDLSVNNISISGTISVSGTISNVRQIIPQLINNTDTNLGTNSNTWQKAFIRELNNVQTINGSSLPTGQTGQTGQTGPTGPRGPIGSGGTLINDISNVTSNLRINANQRIYQSICGEPIYEMTTTYMSWQDHNAAALSQGKTLAVILNAEQNERVRSISNASVYIGALRRAQLNTTGKTSAEWKWVNGDKWSYTNFAGGEPNGSNEVYVNMYSNGTWNDTDGTYPHRAVYMYYVEDPSWNALNGYYGLAKDAYPSLNPYSGGVKAVQNWRVPTQSIDNNPHFCVCWSPELGIFVSVSHSGTANKVMYSTNGINWIGVSQGVPSASWRSVCWSPLLRRFAAIAYNGQCMYSSSGTLWVESTQPAGGAGWQNAICWSQELGIFLAVSDYQNAVTTSKDGIIWTNTNLPFAGNWNTVCWSRELKLFAAVAFTGANRIMISNNGITWSVIPVDSTLLNQWMSVCWSKELGLFVAIAESGTNRIMTSNNGTTWRAIFIPFTENWYGVCWSSELRIFVAVSHSNGSIMTSNNGLDWSFMCTTNTTNVRGLCWSPELGIFAIVGVQTSSSSLKARPPTSYNVFDSSYNSIDETGKWTFNNVLIRQPLVIGTTTYTSDDRLKHNEIIINNGLDIIDQLTPKFYQKTLAMLDASYSGDLSNYAWSYEAGLIAQELLQISDLSFTVGGGDYYEQTYNLITPKNNINFNKNTSNSYYDVSNSYYDVSNSYYDVSYNYYDASNSYYDVSNSYYDASYNYYDASNSYYDASNSYYDASNSYYEISNSYYDASNSYYEISNILIQRPYNVNYNSIFVYGVAAIKELHQKIKTQEININNRQAIIDRLIIRIQALEANS